jgi:hypothetical protein
MSVIHFPFKPLLFPIQNYCLYTKVNHEDIPSLPFVRSMLAVAASSHPISKGNQHQLVLPESILRLKYAPE